MNYDLFFALCTFAFVSSITPGPNNLMLMASGANYGIRRTLPHMFGVSIGFTIMLTLVGVGLIGVFEAFPAIYDLLKVFSVFYLLYLAWKIATAAPISKIEENSGRPFTFIQAALFQWVNPKAWTMALTAISVYAPERNIVAIATVAIVFGIVNLPTISFWASLGQTMRRVLADPFKLRMFNMIMAALLVGSLVPVIFN